jgi:hypothetical protein
LELAGAGVTWGHVNDQPQTIAGLKTFSSSPIIDLGSNTLTTKIFFIISGGSTVTQNIGTLGGSDWLAVGLRLTHSQYDSNGAAVFTAVAYRNGANRAAAIATTASVGTIPASPTVAWSGDILQVTLNETYASCAVEVTVALRGSTWTWA